jgi:urease accessory protein
MDIDTMAMAMGDALPLSLLHFADSAFPAGGYAHSFGLESHCQAGVVTDGAGLARFLSAHLEGAAGPTDATAAAVSADARRGGDEGLCREVDERLEAMKPVRTFREASRQMGRQTLSVAATLTGDGALQRYLVEVNAGRLPGHHAVAFGMAGGVLGWTARHTALGYLYSATALLVGAALRLLPIGQTEGQRVLWGLHPLMERLATEAAARTADELFGFTPAQDVRGMAHERLAARLFRS